jgi:ammonium transporter Rh
MATIELFFYALNEEIGVYFYQAVDMGGSMYVHTFGAVFGLAVAMVYKEKSVIKAGNKLCSNNYYSNLFAMIGTLFLWMFWPSFNGALASGNQQHRVIVNTVLALCASCLGAFMTSAVLHHGKFDMEDVLNATLAGGVIIGSSSDLVVHGFVSMVIGFLGGIVSSMGFKYVTPWLKGKEGSDRLHDTCGVLNLHGLPGILGGMIGALSASLVEDEVYGDDISTIFAARGEGRQAWT